MRGDQHLDMVIIGAGIGGVTTLYYARRAGLSALALEKQNVVGGLWAKLPAWQDIQNNRYDWALGNLPIEGEDSASVTANIRAWVRVRPARPLLRTCGTTRRMGLSIAEVDDADPKTEARRRRHPWTGQDADARYVR